MKTLKLYLLGFIVILFLFSCGKSRIKEVELLPVKSGDEYQYVDREGKIIINAQFSEAAVFSNDLALVKSNGDKPLWGFIDDEGTYVIPATYIYATSFSDDIAWVVSEKGAPTAINDENEVLFTLKDAQEVHAFKEDLAAYSVETKGEIKWGFVNKDGEAEINPQFANVGSFSEGYCAVQNAEGKWGYIDDEGTMEINYQFDYANGFYDKLAIVSKEDNQGVIDMDGKFIVNPQFDYMMHDGDMFLIEKDNKYGWCDDEGKMLINPQFDDAYPFNGNDLAAVKSGEQWGYIDDDGKVVINPQFDDAYPFNGDIAIVKSGEDFGFIDDEGSYLVNPQFTDISTDLKAYIINARTNFNTVNTDYLDINAIISAINISSPEGLSYDCTFNKIIEKYELEDSDFSRYSDTHDIFENKEISNDASYNFAVMGHPYIEKIVTKGSGYYAYQTTEEVFDGSIKVGAFGFDIDLKNNAYEKETDIVNAFIKSMDNFKFDENISDLNGLDCYFNEKDNMFCCANINETSGISIICGTIDYFKTVALYDSDEELEELEEEVAVTASSSSNMPSAAGYSYSANQAIDHDLQTWWSPKTASKNEWIKLNFSERSVNTIEIHAGSHYLNYTTYGNLYPLNSRITKAEIKFSDGGSEIITIKDVDKIQTINFSPHKTTYIKLYPISWVKGDKWDDLCISHISILD
jgi:hypothetical protein